MASGLALEFVAVRIFVSDLTRARHFYKDVLGLTLKSGGIEAGHLVFNAGSAGSVILEEVQGGTRHGADGNDVEGLVGRFTGVSFSVSNMFNAFNYLRENQVAVSGPPEKQPLGGSQLTFFDPDGNGLILVQYEQYPAAEREDTPNVVERIADAVDAATARAMDMMENMEQKIAAMEQSAESARELSESGADKNASISQSEKIDDELTQLKRKAGKLPPPRIVTGDDDAQLPAVIGDDSVDQLPARPSDLDASDGD